MASVRDNLAAVLERVERAAARAGRAAGSVRVLAISKKQPVERIRAAWEAGQHAFGENHVQEFEQKAPMLGFTGAEWHLVGHLQSNKARRAVELFPVIETVDSVRLARRLNEFAGEFAGGAGVHARRGGADLQGCRPGETEPMAGGDARLTGPMAGVDACPTLRVFIEVKLSPEPSKSGCPEDELAVLADAVRQLAHLELCGLMSIPPFIEDPDGARPYFARLREWNQRLRLPELSMGMSHDFEAAIAEGATLVRIGTAIFGERKY